MGSDPEFPGPPPDWWPTATFPRGTWGVLVGVLFELPCVALPIIEAVCESPEFFCGAEICTLLAGVPGVPPAVIAECRRRELDCVKWSRYWNTKVCPKLAGWITGHPECKPPPPPPPDAPLPDSGFTAHTSGLWIPTAHRGAVSVARPATTRLFHRFVPTPKGPIIHGGCSACDDDPELLIEEELD